MKATVIVAASKILDDISGFACFIMCMLLMGMSAALYAFIWFSYMLINLGLLLSN